MVSSLFPVPSFLYFPALYSSSFCSIAFLFTTFIYQFHCVRNFNLLTCVSCFLMFVFLAFFSLVFSLFGLVFLNMFMSRLFFLAFWTGWDSKVSIEVILYPIMKSMRRIPPFGHPFLQVSKALLTSPIHPSINFTW